MADPLQPFHEKQPLTDFHVILNKIALEIFRETLRKNLNFLKIPANLFKFPDNRDLKLQATIKIESCATPLLYILTSPFSIKISLQF